MAATIISFANQKGGCGKSTSASICSYLLSMDYRVCLVDMDAQANASRMVSKKDQGEEKIMTALVERNASPYIRWVSENFSLLPAEPLLSNFDDYLREEVDSEKRPFVLKETLDTIKDFDYIIIDCPPNLGNALTNALTASDFVVVMFEPSQFCYDALETFFNTLEDIQQYSNPRLKIAGILPTLVDLRRSDVKAFLELVRDDYGDWVFETCIKRQAATGRLPVDGIVNNTELIQAIEPYTHFVEELLTRLEAVKVGEK
jgi:chromosome partitioning protein